MSRLRDLSSLSRKPPGPVEVPRPVPVVSSIPKAAQTGTVPVTGTEPDIGTAPDLDTVPVIGTAPASTTVPSFASVPDAGTVPERRGQLTKRMRATRVEHAHTMGERVVLQCLWNRAAGNDRERTIQIGYDALAALASVNWKTAKATLKSLERKLAIETIGTYSPELGLGRTYRVYSFEAILERRRAAGLVEVEKRGRGVAFVQTGTVPASNTEPAIATVPRLTTVPERGTDTVPANGAGTVPVSGTLLRSIEEEERTSTPTAFFKLIGQIVPKIDRGAIRRIWAEARDLVPDATEEEIAFFLDQRCEILYANKRVENKVGAILTSISDWFEPEMVLERRAENI